MLGKSQEGLFRIIASGARIEQLLFHEKLNVIFVKSSDGYVTVVDPTVGGEVIYCTNFGANAQQPKNFSLDIVGDKVVVADDKAIGVRSEYQGIILLDTILQTPVKDPSDLVVLELNLSEAESLCHSLRSAVDPATEADTAVVEKHLKSRISKANELQESYSSVKHEKWTTVKIELPFSVLKSTFQSMVTELWKKNAYIPQLSIASSIVERLNMMLPSSKAETDVVLDKTLMFSESSRLATFHSWPHKDYKWALPDKMAQAGFYHNPNRTGEDRALCFSCNVCLVSWEPTDEPWSEHERHSPFCPFVRGEHTHNVPLHLTYATSPAFKNREVSENALTILGRSACSNAFVVGSANGFLRLYNTSNQAKVKNEALVIDLTVQYNDIFGLSADSIYCDVNMRPKEAWVNTMAQAPGSGDQDIGFNVSALALVQCPHSTKLSANLSVVVGLNLKSNGEFCIPTVLVYRVLAKAETSTGSSKEIIGKDESKLDAKDKVKQESGGLTEALNLKAVPVSSSMPDQLPLLCDLSPGFYDEFDFLSKQSPAATDKGSGKLVCPPAQDKALPNKRAGMKEIPYTLDSSRPPVALTIPSSYRRNFRVSDMFFTPEGSRLIVILSAIADTSANGSVVIVYTLYPDLNADLQIQPNPEAVKHFEKSDDLIVSSCYVPPDLSEPAITCVFTRGDAEIISLSKLEPMCTISCPDSSVAITSATYCSSLERLCCGTSHGTMLYYAVGTDDDFGVCIKDQTSEMPESSSNSFVEGLNDPSLLTNQKLNLNVLKTLLELTSFDANNSGFSANVPSCWTTMNQAQKDRKHPQHLQHQETELSSTTLSWRLQRNKLSRREHLFELSLPTSTYVGHIDLKFMLQLGCSSIQSIEVTLYRATKLKPCVDSKNRKGNLKNKNQATEFLKSINAEKVCGPLDLGWFMDLSGNSGNIVMTSPTLMLTKARNFYVHLKAKHLPGKHEPSVAQAPQPSSSKMVKTRIDLATKSSSATKVLGASPFPSSSGLGSKVLQLKAFQQQNLWNEYHGLSSGSPFLTGHPVHKPLLDNNGVPIPDVPDKKKDYGGCDWINEISITVRPLKTNDLVRERQERSGLLMSEMFLKNLISIVSLEAEEKSVDSQNAALDLLIWISAVTLSGPLIGAFNYQSQLIQIIQGKLSAFVRNAIICAGRSTSHKAAKVLIMCIEASENYLPTKDRLRFPTALLETMLEMLPLMTSCNSAGSMHWFFLILNRVRHFNLNISSECLLEFLKDVTEELHSRADPLHALLRTRFGLYGTPFEPELFDLDVPHPTKVPSYVGNYAGVCTHDMSSPSSGVPLSQPSSTAKDIDFRELLFSSASFKFNKANGIPSKQLPGLLEIEPLHFVCHAASDGTRLEKVDTPMSAFASASLPQPWESSTNMPTGEGSKKAEADKMEQIMMLHKALKMDTYYDSLPEFHYIGLAPGNKMEPSVYSNVVADTLSSAQFQLAPKITSNDPNWKNMGVLTMVMQPNPGGSSASAYLQNDPSKAEIYMPPPLFSSHTMAAALGAKPFKVMPYFPKKVAAASLSADLSSQSKPTASNSQKPEVSSSEQESLKLLMSPWQQIMYIPPQQAMVIDRMHSGARRFVVLDFGAPILLTDIVIPSCGDLVSLSIDTWLHREETDGQRLVVVSDIGSRALILSDLQPPPICRYLKITIIGRYGMGTTKCRIPVGMFYGHTVILPTDTGRLKCVPSDVPVCSPSKIQPHLAVLNSLIEDIGCRYRIACDKLKRLLEPLLKPEITSLDHISYYLPRGKERNKLGYSASTDQSILNAYQECTSLQAQLNIARQVVRRLQNSADPILPTAGSSIRNSLKAMCTDQVHVISDHLTESLLGISYVGSSGLRKIPVSLYSGMDATFCENLFRNVCVLENGQCQLLTCILMLRVGGFQPWWGEFLALTLKSLFSSRNTLVFPQDRVFILLVYLGQKALLQAHNATVIEAAIELIKNLLLPVNEEHGFLSSKIDMSLFGWVVMYLCLCMDGISTTYTAGEMLNKTRNKGASGDPKGSQTKLSGTYITSRWDFIQGESALYRRVSGSPKSNSMGLFKRRIQKKLMATKQKLEELDSVASGFTYPSQIPNLVGLGNQLSALGNKLESMKQKQASIGKSIKMQSSKHFKDLLQMRRSDMLCRKGISGASTDASDESVCVDLGVNLNLDSSLCLGVAQNLSALLLRMDSTCHSDVYLIVCKALARIATACRPALRLGQIFSAEQIVRLILTAVGGDYVRQRNWSSSWISHAIMCLVQDILEGERIFPIATEFRGEKMAVDPMPASQDAEDVKKIQQLLDDVQHGADMMVDEVDAAIADSVTHSGDDISHMSGSSDELDYEDASDTCLYTVEKLRRQNSTCLSGRNGRPRKYTSSSTGISSALDARLETGIESQVELRLRFMSALKAEVLSDVMKAPLEIPEEFVRKPSDDTTRFDDYRLDSVDSCKLLQQCFEHIFDMMASETCAVSIVKVLQLWVSINSGIPSLQRGDDGHTVQPAVPLSPKSVASLMLTLTKNNGIGVQEWGLAFQTLTLVLNQKNSHLKEGDWLLVLQNENFPEIILRFISGSGMNLQKMHLTSVGPTVCQQFYNFLTRMRELSHDTPWTNCLKEVLLRILCAFLSGPFLETDFPTDAFNKFLDRVTCPDLSYENPGTVCKIIQEFAHALHVYTFFPNKISIRSASESRNSCMAPGGPLAKSGSAAAVTDSKSFKNQDFEQIMFRLVSFVTSCLSLPFKEQPENEVSSCMDKITFSFKFKNFESRLTDPLKSIEGDGRPKSIADLVLKMEKTMMRILSVLANPNGINVLASGDLVGAFNILETSNPTTVVDAVIHLFCKLCGNASDASSTIQSLFRFLSKSPYDDFYCPLIVSETFVLMVLKVISSEDHLKEFTELKCVEAVCHKLISSTKKFFSSCPTFVSILTQYIGKNDRSSSMGQKKFVNDSLDISEGLINVAPLGTIASVNVSANPSDVLLQATAPHRRARTPVWSYHFLPDEQFLELVVTLPCAILLKEVQILPHFTTSFSTCPSAVMVEVSRDRSSCTLPMGPPVQCGGLSSINIQLTAPEVAQTVLLRMFKPKDSTNLGLSQIRLLGCTTFSEAALEGLSPVESSRNLEASAQWMYILDRAITVAWGSSTLHLHRTVTETAMQIPGMLESCYSMLVAPVASNKIQEVYLPHVASVLFHFGNLNKQVSKELMQALLGPVQHGFSSGMVANATSQHSSGQAQLHTAIELVYKLCCNVPLWGTDNLMTVVSWLDQASSAKQNPDSSNDMEKTLVVPEYVQSVAAILWSLNAAGKTDLTGISTPQFFVKLYEWTKSLDPRSELKASLDHVLCSLCYIKPYFLVKMMWDMGLIKVAEWSGQTDCVEESLEDWYDEGSVWGHLQCREDYEMANLKDGYLLTLARAALSPACCGILEASELLLKLNEAIMKFWAHYNSRWLNTDQQYSVGSGVVSASQIISILRFYTELCRVNFFKNWFGGQGSNFWFPLLNLLSSMPESLKSSFFGAYSYDLESTVIGFLAKCCWSHPENQSVVATCLCEIISKQKQLPHKAVFLHSMSSFCRRLLLQLLLENEKTVVHVKNATKCSLRNPESALSIQQRHPSMGVNEGDRIFLISTHSFIYDILKSIEPFGTSGETSSNSSSDRAKFLSMLKKEQGIIEAGLEMIDQMQLSISGNAAKEKRAAGSSEKRHIKTAAKKLKPESGVVEGKTSSRSEEKTHGLSLILESEEFPNIPVPTTLPTAALMAAVRSQRCDLFLNTIVFTVRTESISTASFQGSKFETCDTCQTANNNSDVMQVSLEAEVDAGSTKEAKKRKDSIPEVFNFLPLPSTIEVFSRAGGFGLLAKHLPVVYPETLRQMSMGSKFPNSGPSASYTQPEKGYSGENEWVPLGPSDDLYEELFGNPSSVGAATVRKSATINQLTSSQGIPPHSMAAFGLFLALPRFSEVLLSERIGAQCMLRLVMGVTDDAEGNDIFGSAVAKTLPTLPFQVLWMLLNVLPLDSDDGKLLRKAMVDVKAIHFILACLAVFTHQNCDSLYVPGVQHELVIAATKAQGGYQTKSTGKSDDKSHVYWAKGTGFGTGSTAQSWDVEQALQRKKHEEEHVTSLLLVLSSYIKPKVNGESEMPMETEQISTKVAEPPHECTTDAQQSDLNDGNYLPTEIYELLLKSCLFPAVSAYLRNDSVLDMARHVPLYRAVLELLRALTTNSQLAALLIPVTGEESDEQAIPHLLSKMKGVVDSYSKRLTSSKSKNPRSKSASTKQTADDLEDEGLALLIPDIQRTAILVQETIAKISAKRGGGDVEMKDDASGQLDLSRMSLEDRYTSDMQKLQFAFYDMIAEDEDSGGNIRFNVSHHYEGNVRHNWTRSSPARLKRLAQESVTLSTSLPIAYGSTIFVRCDTDRLDVMKVLITGPAGTPYANGCFEFDVFFPHDYPNSPLLINLETTGRQRVRFNPNLYNDGKVCLSLLNTWHGRPEEKWNPQTSSLLPVLVAIQSLILNAEPYFNEPGYEKSRGTDNGEKNAREYNAGIQLATVEWAMLDQLRHPSPCFKEVIQRHFFIKRDEVIAQCEKWLEEITITCRNDKRTGKHLGGTTDPVNVFKNNFAQLKKELLGMKPPPGLEDLAESGSSFVSASSATGELAAGPSSSTSKLISESPVEQPTVTSGDQISHKMSPSSSASTGSFLDQHAKLLQMQAGVNKLLHKVAGVGSMDTEDIDAEMSTVFVVEDDCLDHDELDDDEDLDEEDAMLMDYS